MRRVVLALIALVGYAEAFVAPQPTSAPLTVVAGRNDKRTKKGKIYAGSNGKSRPRKPGGEKGPVDPCRGRVHRALPPTDWRNGSASDSSPEGYVFESRIGHVSNHTHTTNDRLAQR